MVPLSISGLAPEGNLSFPLLVIPGPWPSSGGPRLWGMVRSGGVGLEAPLRPHVRPLPARRGGPATSSGNKPHVLRSSVLWDVGGIQNT